MLKVTYWLCLVLEVCLAGVFFYYEVWPMAIIVAVLAATLFAARPSK